MGEWGDGVMGVRVLGDMAWLTFVILGIVICDLFVICIL